MSESGDPAATTPRIEVTPQTALADTPVRIRLVGFPPGRQVTLRARMAGRPGHHWESWAGFVADDEGLVDVSTQRPRHGTYGSADPIGFIWSMEPRLGEIAAPIGIGGPIRASAIELCAEIDGLPAAETTVVRLGAAPDIRRTVVRDSGLVATLFRPGKGGPYPAVILLGGAEGGLHEPDAALLASHGYAVLALAYFGTPPLTRMLINIPLEYFEAAIAWLQARKDIAGDRLGVMGGSRGGELALLLGATFPALRAVVSYLGSGVITEGIGSGHFLQMVNPKQPSWTFRGQALPYLPLKVTPELVAQVESGGPVELGLVFRAGLEDVAARDAAVIPVERINGPVLLLSAGDDRGWPSEVLSEIALQRLRQHKHPHPVHHQRYPGAGHGIIPPPYGPTTQLEGPGPGVTFKSGGTAPANAFARADAWQRTLRFFLEHLQ